MSALVLVLVLMPLLERQDIFDGRVEFFSAGKRPPIPQQWFQALLYRDIYVHADLCMRPVTNVGSCTMC